MRHLEALIARMPSIASIKEDIVSAFELLRGCYRRGGKLLVAGNGGSAADAEHIVGELMKGFLQRRPLGESLKKDFIENGNEYGAVLANNLQEALPAIALTGHTSLTTAFGNDVKPELVFAQQLFGYGHSGDVFLAISTSGNSGNILYAAAAAKAMEVKVIGLTGEDGGKLNKLADIMVRVPEQETPLVQELHMPLYHCWCAMLEEDFYGG